MAKRRLPADSKAFQELVFREEAKWHRRRARMSFQRKLEVLDRLRERAKEIARGFQTTGFDAPPGSISGSC